MMLLFQYNVYTLNSLIYMDKMALLKYNVCTLHSLIKRDKVACGYLLDNIHVHTSIHTGLEVL